MKPHAPARSLAFLTVACCAVACQKATQPEPPARPATEANPSGAETQAVPIKTVPVAGHIYMLEGAGGNIGVSAGKSLPQVQKAGLPAYRDWASGFITADAWIETLYRSI
jgi:hypothetical protein